jgi:uncharacterized membrane protein YjjP (DUF1212 family)
MSFSSKVILYSVGIATASLFMVVLFGSAFDLVIGTYVASVASIAFQYTNLRHAEELQNNIMNSIKQRKGNEYE